ncbi:MAG TPA: MarR family transcriptional regulator [Ktedonobacterales bacterium]
MSSGNDTSPKNTENSGNARTQALRALEREVRQFSGLGASYFRAVAARAGMNATDAQALDLLSATGPASAGRIADLMGVTTGAVTQMLDRLEEAGRIRRERDPEDGRRVIVGLIPGEAALRDLGPIFANVSGRWDEVAARYDEAQLALLTEFLSRASAVTRDEIIRLREEPVAGASGDFSAPLGALASGQLTVASGGASLVLRARASMPELYEARFEGPLPEVKANDGVVTVRYPRQFLGMGAWQSSADITLNGAIPWLIAIQSKATTITARLRELDLAGLNIKGGYSAIDLELAAPSGLVPIKVSGGVSTIKIHRPAGAAARVHLKGWASHLTLDDQFISNAGENVRLQSSGYDAAADRYDIEVSGAASMITVTAG